MPVALGQGTEEELPALVIDYGLANGCCRLQVLVRD
jgi:hypothetical protein